MRLKAKLTLTILFLSSIVCAQTGKFFNTDHQLSSSFVTQVYLDNEGYIWATTRNGINRYDGYQFKVFRQETEEGKTLASNYVNSMVQDRNGLFYFGMYGALQTWDGHAFRDVAMKGTDGRKNSSYATCLLERANGEVVVGTSGMGLMVVRDRQNAVQLGGPLAGIHTVREVLEDADKHLWMVTDVGLISYDGKSIRHYLQDRKDLAIQKICLDHHGTLYVGTANAGLFKQEGSDFRHIEATGVNPVSALFCDKKGIIFIGYDGKGLAAYNPETGMLEQNPFYSLEVDIAKSKIYSITEDRSGNIWLGMLQKGIFKQPTKSSGFKYMGYRLGGRNFIGSACVISLLVDSQGRKWVGTDKDGIYCFDRHDKLLKHYAEGIPSTVMTMAEDNSGRIWIGSYGEGFGMLDPVTGSFRKVSKSQIPTRLNVMDIAVDRQGMFWLATMSRGLFCVDPSKGEVVKSYAMDPKSEFDEHINSITNDYISQVSVSPDGNRVYASTSMGLCCLDVPSGSWTKSFGRNCLNYGTPVRVAGEFGGKLWVGTNSGLFCYSLKGEKEKHYMVADGLSDNGIAAIEEDEQHNLWIATDRGLSCLNPANGLLQNYFVDDGLQSNEFSDGTSLVAPDGTLFFGGVGGVTWFKAKDVAESKWDATVQLTSFSVNGLSVSQDETDNHYFELSYSDNSFAIQFSTLTYENPEHISYLYSINGEPFFRLQPGLNEINFAHLPPGTYRFRVKAERNNVSTPVKEFTVVIHSPWYRSAWAYFIYALIIGLFTWQYLAFRRHREQSRLRLQEHIHAEEMGEAKLRFFINMSHEIRTPMTLIITPLLSLIKHEEDPQRKSTYETIKRNAERILSLINQMMDLRKIDKGQMQMRMSETDMVAFIRDIHTLFESQAKMKGINLLFEHDAESLPVWVDRSNFDKVIMNVLSNAFKFTPAGGEIGIRLTHDDQHATIVIRDNGEKIPEDKLDKIFQRFYQSASTINDRHAGTGIGLDLTRSLVELHHGTITAHNLEKGCEFIITIPLGCEHLKPEEIQVGKDEDIVLPEATVTEPEELLLEGNDEERSSNRRQTIVVAEDDDEIRNFLYSELSRDYEVHCCANGRDALTEVIHTIPDLLISDVMMPELDGNTLCSKLKSNPSTNYIPIILLTAKSRDEDKLEGLETGADAYLVKPFNMDILQQTIVNLINSHRLLRLKYERNDVLEEHVDTIQLKSPDEKLLDRIMNSVNKNLSNSDVSIDQIAEEVGVSRVHLHRKMKELTGQTPHEFLRNIRLKKAASLLSRHGANVTEVMYACGFSNPASFSTLFKKFYGMSPRDYMREHEERN